MGMKHWMFYSQIEKEVADIVHRVDLVDGINRPDQHAIMQCDKKVQWKVATPVIYRQSIASLF